MPRRPTPFTQDDIKRAFAGAAAAGVTTVRIEIDHPNGGKFVVYGSREEKAASANSWSDLDGPAA